MKSESVKNVDVLHEQNDDSKIEHYSVEVIENEQPPFPPIADRFGDFRLCDYTCYGTSKKRPVVDTSHIVAGTSETKWNPENQHSRISPSRDFQAPKVNYIRRENWAGHSMIIVMYRTIKKNQSDKCVD